MCHRTENRFGQFNSYSFLSFQRLLLAVVIKCYNYASTELQWAWLKAISRDDIIKEKLLNVFTGEWHLALGTVK